MLIVLKCHFYNPETIGVQPSGSAAAATTSGVTAFSRRLEWAFDSQKLVAALNFVY